MDRILPIFDPPPLSGQFSYPERGQKWTFFDPLPPSSCPCSYWRPLYDSFMTLSWLFHVLLNCFFNENHLNDYWQRKFEIWNWFFIFLWKILWTDYFELQRISKFICYWLVSFIFSGIAHVFRDWSKSQPSLRACWPSWVVS